MSQIDNSTGALLASHVPLFASSWMALFLLIRHQFRGERAPARIRLHKPPRRH